MIEWITKFTEGAEEVVDVLTNSAGMIITRVTPLLAPLASGFTVLFAFYDGGGRMLASITPYAYMIAFWVGFVLMLALEGINFSTTFNRDRAERLKTSHTQALSGINADQLVSYAFWLTVAIVAGLETAPGAIGFAQGTVTGSDLTFKAGLLILPFFSKIGAKIFSLAVILDSLEGTHEARRQRRLQVKRDAADLEIEIETKRQEAALRLAQIEAESKQKLELDRLKAESKIQQNSVKSVAPKSVEKTVENQSPTPEEGENSTGKKAKIQQRRNMIFQHIKMNGDPGPTALSEQFSVDRGTIYGDLKAMEKAGIVHQNGAGWTPSPHP